MADITIKSLIRAGPHTFIPIEDFHDRLPRFYVEGAVVLTVDGRILLDEGQWDLIDQLWCYLVEGIELLARGEDFETFFPDDPAWIRFRIDPGGAMATVSVKTNGVREARAPRDEWLAAFGEAAAHFFEQLDRLGGASCEEYRSRVRSALAQDDPGPKRRHHR